MEKPSPAKAAWIGLGVGVSVYEMLCPDGQTLSEEVDRVLENPRVKYLALGAIAVTAAHLANVLPEQIDPFEQVLSKARRRVVGRIYKQIVEGDQHE